MTPRYQWRNPVMFVVYVGSILTTVPVAPGARPARARRRPASSSPSRSGCGSRCCSPTSPRRWPRAAARRRRPRSRARARTRSRRSSRAPSAARRRPPSPSSQLRKGDLVLRRAGRPRPGDGEVVEGVASVNESAITGESAPVIREAGSDFSARHRRHARAVRLDHRAHHRQSGRDVPRPHDRDGRGREAAEDAERDRADDPARRADDRLPARDRHAAAVLALQRRRRQGGHAGLDHRARRAARLPDPDDDRRPALRDRHRRHGPHDPGQRRSRRRAAPSRPRATATCCCSTRPARSRSATARRRRFIPVAGVTPQQLADATQLASLADETPEGKSIVVLAKRAFGLAPPPLEPGQFTHRPVHRADAHERRRPVDGRELRKGALDAIRTLGRRAQGGAVAAEVHGARRRRRRAAARRRWSSPKAGTCSASSS